MDLFILRSSQELFTLGYTRVPYSVLCLDSTVCSSSQGFSLAVEFNFYQPVFWKRIFFGGLKKVFCQSTISVEQSIWKVVCYNCLAIDALDCFGERLLRGDSILRVFILPNLEGQRVMCLYFLLTLISLTENLVSKMWFKSSSSFERNRKPLSLESSLCQPSGCSTESTLCNRFYYQIG